MENKEDIAAFANVTKDTLEGGDVPSTPAPAAPATTAAPVAAAPESPSIPVVPAPSTDVNNLQFLPHP